MEPDVVGTLDGRNIGECRLGVGAGHTGEFLAHGVGICSHDVETLDGAHVERYARRVSVTLVGVLEHECLGAGTEHVGIKGTVVHAVEPCESADRHDAPVGNGHTVDSLVVDELTGEREGERSGERVVEGNRSLPYLGHLEVGIYRRDRRREFSVLGLDSRRITEACELVEQGLCGSLAVLVGHETAGEIVHRIAGNGLTLLGKEFGQAILVELCLVLHHTAVGRHVGEEHERQTA